MQWYRVVALAAMAFVGVVAVAGTAQAAPAAKLNGPDHAVAGQTITLDASESTGEGLRFVWNFGDGTFEMGGPVMTHTYTAPGTYTVTLNVVDEDAQDAFAALTVTVVEAMATEVDGMVIAPVIEPPPMAEPSMLLP
jgi:hypothetical protein